MHNKNDKSLWYEGRYGLTEDGNALEDDTIAALRPIFNKYIEAGYSVREIGHIIVRAVGLIESEIALTEGVKRRRKDVEKFNHGH